MTLKERLNKTTLKELINEIKNFDNNYGYETKISVYITSVGTDGKRHTVIIDPDSKRTMDQLAILGFEDCTVSEFSTYELSDKEHLLVIIVDLDKHYDNVISDKWWRK